MATQTDTLSVEDLIGATDTTTPVPTPDISDLELANKVRQLFYNARTRRRPKVAQWSKNYRLLRNRTWNNYRPPWMPNPEIPEIIPILATLTAWMTDQRPTFSATPAMQSASPFRDQISKVSDDLKTVMQSLWTVHKFEAETEKAVWDSYIYGTGVFKCGWNNALDNGLGNAQLQRIDPYSFYPDPNATSLTDANYFIEANRISIQEMDRRWPGSAKKVGQGGWLEDLDTRPDLTGTESGPMANPGAIAPATSPRFGRPGQSSVSAASPTDDPGIVVLEAWLRYHEVIPQSPDNPNPPQVIDSWRVVVVAGQQILMDEKARDLWDHNGHPYETFVPFNLGEFWGLSLVELLAPAQLSINRLLAALQHNVELVGNPVFKESSRAGLSRTQITNQPGQRLPVTDQGIAEWMNPPQVHPMMFELVKFYISRMEYISGLTALLRGQAPAGRNATDTIASIQDGAFVRVRSALRNFEWALRSCGEKLAALVAQNYTTPRFVAITGPEGQNSALALQHNHFYTPGFGPSYPIRFTLLVQAGSTNATSTTERRNNAKEMYAMGAIDRTALLEAFDYPGRTQIIDRITKLEAAGAFNPPGKRQQQGRLT